MTNKSIFHWSVFLLFLSFSFLFLLNCFSDLTSLETGVASRSPYLSEAPPSKNDKPPEIKLAFVGDIMMDRGVKKMADIYGEGDLSYITKRLEFPDDLDIVFGNLEGPASDVGRDLNNKYSFRMNPSAVEVLADTGFSVLSVANNHAGDWGRDAFVDTLDNLEEAGILATGGGHDINNAGTPAVIETNGLSVAFLGFSDVGPDWMQVNNSEAGILNANSDNFDEYIVNAAENSDILVVSFHFGSEYQKEPSDRQKYLARRAIDLGADIVAGHHPHVTQPVEKYRGGLIAYSLGNFIFDQDFSQETMEGSLLVVGVREGDLSYHYTRKIKMNDRFQPRLEN